MFDRGTIAEFCVPMRGKGEEEESNTFSTWGGSSRPAGGAWLAGDESAPVEGKVAAAAAAEEAMGRKKKLGPAVGEKKEF